MITNVTLCLVEVTRVAFGVRYRTDAIGFTVSHNCRNGYEPTAYKASLDRDV